MASIRPLSRTIKEITDISPVYLADCGLDSLPNDLEPMRLEVPFYPTLHCPSTCQFHQFYRPTPLAEIPSLQRHQHHTCESATRWAYLVEGEDWRESVCALLLASSVPTTYRFVSDAITKHNDIASRSLRDQWQLLVLDPLSKLGGNGCCTSYILVVDAPDLRFRSDMGSARYRIQNTRILYSITYHRRL